MSTADFSFRETSNIIEPVIRFLSPHVSESRFHFINDLVRKCAHLSEYFFLGLLLFRAFKEVEADMPPGRVVMLSVVIIALYAASDEFHQTSVYSRTPSLVDVGIDTAGGILAQITCLLFKHDRGFSRKSV